MTKNKAKALIEQTNGKFFGVSFLKKDGTTRKMNCRLGVKKYLKGGTSSVQGDDSYVVVYDMVAKGYRTINLTTVQEVHFKGLK